MPGTGELMTFEQADKQVLECEIFVFTPTEKQVLCSFCRTKRFLGFKKEWADNPLWFIGRCTNGHKALFQKHWLIKIISDKIEVPISNE